MNRQIPKAQNQGSWFTCFIIFSVFVLVSAIARSGSVSINEFMASNATTIADEDGDFEDWIEIYNYGSEPVNLQGWGLSDNLAQPYKWVFPSVTIEPGGFLLVWASGKDRYGEELHTSFSISSEGEPLLLVMPDGNWKDLVNAVALPTDVSYGRTPDGTGEWFFFNEPTPGLPNTTDSWAGILEPPVFSHLGGFYTSGFDLSLSHPDPGVTIIFTLDGSDPSPDNLEGVTYHYKNKYAFTAGSAMGDLLENNYYSHVYESPLAIEDRSALPDKLTGISSTVQDPDYFPSQPVFKGTVVRAKAVKEGYLSSRVVTYSYFVTPEGRAVFTLPVISLAIQEDYLFDYHNGIYTAGVDADLWRENNPGQTFTWPFAGNFRRRGDLWEYPANFEYIDASASRSAISQQVGLRIHGGATRSFPMKSLRVYARNMYGQSTLDYPFFENNSQQGFKRLILRNSGNDFPTNIWEPDRFSRTLFRDAAIQKIMGHLNVDTQDYSPVIVFVNGEYWGIHNIRERFDKHFLERVHGVDPDNIDLLSGHGDVKEGDNNHYTQTFNYIAENGLESDHHYQYIQTRIDTESFADYQIANIFAGNTDWPGNNIDYWRVKTEQYNPDAPPGHDGRWRWMLYDTDFGFGLWNGSESYMHNTLAFATEAGNSGWPNPDWSTLMLRNFLKNPTFRNHFINRFADLLNSSLKKEFMIQVIETMQENISNEIPGHIERWNQPMNIAAWGKNVDVMKEFAAKRPQYQVQHIKSFFNLNGTFTVDLDVTHPWHGHIRINTLDVHSSTPGIDNDPYPWRGNYFRDVPVEITAVPAPGYRFSHWTGSINSTENTLVYPSSGDLELKAHFIPTYEQMLLHFWFFGDQLPNDTPLHTISSTYYVNPGSELVYRSCLPGYPYAPGHNYWRKGSMERRNSPTAINYRPEGNQQISFSNSNMRALQVKQPMQYNGNESELIFLLPTTGQKDIVFRFAVKDEGAAQYLLVDYATDSLENWTSALMENPQIYLTDSYQLAELDFTNIEAANNNPEFRIRIRFGGPLVQEMDGNRVTFNNFSLNGVVSMANRINAIATGPGEIYPSGRINLFETEEQTFLLSPKPNHILEDLLLDGESVMEQLSPGLQDHQWLYTFKDPVANHTLEAVFSFDPSLLDEDDGLLIYPNPTQGALYIVSLGEIQKLELFDLKGAKLLERQGIKKNNYTLQTDFLKSGLYLLIITAEEGQRYSRKIQIFRN